MSARGEREKAARGRRANASQGVPPRERVNRAAVLARDGGVCAVCGYPAGRVERILQHAAAHLREWGAHPVAVTAWVEFLRKKLGGAADHLWEADHKMPVLLGGGGAGLDNIQTLCVPCHKRRTARQQAVRGKINRAREKAPIVRGPGEPKRDTPWRRKAAWAKKIKRRAG